MAYDNLEMQNALYGLLNQGNGGLTIAPPTETGVITEEQKLRDALLQTNVERMRAMQELQVAQHREAAFLRDQQASKTKSVSAAPPGQAAVAPSAVETALFGILNNAISGNKGLNASNSSQVQPPSKEVTAAKETPTAEPAKVDPYVDSFNKKSIEGQFDLTPEEIASGSNTNRIVASRQKNGVVSFTNIGTTPQPLPLTGTSATELATADSINKSILALQGRAPLEIAQGMESIKASGMSTLQAMEAASLTKARAMANLPKLEASLEQAKIQDAALAAKGTPASQLPHAKAVLLAIENANKLASSISERELGGNVTYVSIKSKIEGLDKNPVLGVIGQESTYKDTQDKIDKASFDALPAEAQANYARAFPDKSQDFSAMSKAAKSLPTEDQVALTQTKDELLLNAVANPQNTTAGKLVTRMMEEDNVPAKEAQTRLAEMHRLMTDDKAFAKIAGKQISPDEVGAAATSKASMEMLKAKKANIVINYMNKTATDLFVQNPTDALAGLAATDPAFKTAMDSAPTKDLRTIAQLYIGDDYATGFVKAQNLRGYLAKTLENRKKTLIGNVDYSRIIDELPVLRKQSRLEDFLDRIPRGAERVGGVLLETPIGQAATAEVNAVGDAWDWLSNPDSN